jgi:hypothetical protein
MTCGPEAETVPFKGVRLGEEGKYSEIVFQLMNCVHRGVRVHRPAAVSVLCLL